MPEKYVLEQYRHLPLKAKESMSKSRIITWHEYWYGKVWVSFSGGKDSTVLAHLVHELFPNVPLVYANTGLEYPEIQAFAKRMGAVFVYPKMHFSEVISTYGYPIISKEVSGNIYYARKILTNGMECKHEKTTRRSRSELLGEHKRIISSGESEEYEKSRYNKEKWLQICRDTEFNISNHCCSVMKEGPMMIYQRKHKSYPYVGTLTEESLLREASWIKYGCNSFEGKNKKSRPLSFWTEQDILHYIKEKGIEVASVYGEILAVDDDGLLYDPMPDADYKLKCTGCKRTGCIFCGFGFHLEKGKTRFQRLAVTHPRQYEYCMEGGQWVDNPDYDPFAPKYDGEWENWNPKKIWVPSKKGLGMKKVFDDCNAIYGKNLMRYE